MERWEGKVAVVTGAGSGIGAAVATSLVQKGLIVVGIDISGSSLQDLEKKLSNEKGRFCHIKTDVTKEKEILDAFIWIDINLGGIHVFINNVGILPNRSSIAELETDQMKNVLDINVLALTICSREALKSMKKYQIDDGNIINIASIVALISTPTPGFVIYAASKKAVQVISEGMRNELALEKSKIKVTTICPGITSTNIYNAYGSSLSESIPRLCPENVADTIVFCLQMPPEAHITELHVRPICENLSRF